MMSRLVGFIGTGTAHLSHPAGRGRVGGGDAHFRCIPRWHLKASMIRSMDRAFQAVDSQTEFEPLTVEALLFMRTGGTRFCRQGGRDPQTAAWDRGDGEGTSAARSNTSC